MIKIKKRKFLLLPGDGIGPEVVAEVKKIINWFNTNKSLDFEIDEDLAGGASYDKHGTPITDEVFYKALECEAVILGAVGGPKWDNLEFSKKPERALLKLRKELKLFANLRPAICLKQLIQLVKLKELQELLLIWQEKEKIKLPHVKNQMLWKLVFCGKKMFKLCMIETIKMSN